MMTMYPNVPTKLKEGTELPAYSHEGDAGIDLCATERDHWHVEQIHAFSNWEDAYKRATELEAENAKLRMLLSSALIVAGYSGRQYLDTYLQEEEGTTLWQELKGLGIEVADA